MMFNTPDWASDRFRIFASNTGPISDNVTLTGKPFWPNRSQNSTGYCLKLNPLSSRPYFCLLFVMKSVSEPAFASPEMSPFISARNTGTPRSEKDSAMTFNVTVFPVPVAPAIKP